MQYFGMNGTATYAAIMSNELNLSTVAQTLDKRLASVLIYYDELSYTKIDQDPKMEVTLKALKIRKSIEFS
jgi:S-adenosylmethionine:diacylglycerol 3-amino-3-carboxypropyl transferase